MTHIHWGKALRRTAACFTATAALWLLTLTADFSGAAEVARTLVDTPAFAAVALQLELGFHPEADGQPSPGRWGQLALRQSPFFSAWTGRTGREEVPDEEPDDPHDPADLPAATTAPEEIEARTLTHADGNLSAADISVNNTTGQSIDVAALAAAPVQITLGDGPQILIMHTHGTEAYTMDGTDNYTSSDAYRTTDPNFNVVRIGTEIQSVLTEMGFSVLHDTRLHDYPAYSGAYDRSKEAVEQYLAEYPSIKVVLDVHRDALVGADGTTYKTRSVVNGEETAQVMLVVGSNDTGLEHPHWQENLTLAIRLQQRLSDTDTTLPRPITVRTNRFNQQLTTGSLLVEVGSHGNTLQEALAAARLFARAAGEELSTLNPPP